MHYRKLLLPLSDTPSGEAALVTALRLARLWRAHLLAVIVRVDRSEIAPLSGEGLSGVMIEDMIAATERESAERAIAAERMFVRMAEEHGVAVRAPSPQAAEATAALETRSGREEDLIPAMARLADLTVLPHPYAEEDAAASDCLHSALFESGRPVMVSPPAPPANIGRRCCLAWNATPESSAALSAMLPFLVQAEAVRVLHAPEYQRRGPDAGEVLPYLALHGVHAHAVEFRPVDRNVGAGLLAACQAFEADLLGMGAYSHSRLRQLILGGVTRHVLGAAALPVLMSH